MAIEIENLSKTYGTAGGGRVAVEGVSFTVDPGEFVSVVGPSGCGKSTLLMMMAGLLPATAGTVRFDGTVVNGPADGLSVVFQDYSRSLFPWMTVGKNVEMALKDQRLTRAQTRERITHALESVALPGSAKLYPWQLSGGMQQRVAIARALAPNPTVMLMDEPLAAVDAQTRADLEDLVLRVRREYDVTVVFVTHDIDEAVYLADRILVMAANPGRILAEVQVPLTRPRDQVDTKKDPLYVSLRSKVFELVMRRRGGEAPRADGAGTSADRNDLTEAPV
jgi:NitT/TauT family transport system ATP-binding protein